nr:MliC family protein [uncultured Kingella sp.]
MNIKLVSLIAVSAVALAACAGSESPAANNDPRDSAMDNMSMQQQQAMKPQVGGSKRFECDNGMTATAKYSSGAINLSVDTMGKSAVLNQAMSASGVRYASNSAFYGNPAEWHEKAGREAYFEFSGSDGSKVSTTCVAK